MSADLNIKVPRNGHYFQEWQLRDAAGQPIDVSGSLLAMDARAIAGTGAVVASAQIILTIGSQGQFSVQWTGSDFDGFGAATEIVRLAYDLKRTADGITEIPVRGHLILMPEVTA